MIRFNGPLATSQAANRPRRRDPNISPVHSIEEAQVPPTHAADGARGAGYRFKYSLALSALGFIGRPPVRAPGIGGGARAECWSTPPARTPQLLNTFAGSFCCGDFDNDPSAGSPTKTLLQLLLPLNDKVQWTSRDVAGSEPPTSTRFEHFTGSSYRQIAPPTKNGHAPPPIESRKSSQSVNPYYVWTWPLYVIKLQQLKYTLLELELPRLLAPDLPSGGNDVVLGASLSTYAALRIAKILQFPWWDFSRTNARTSFGDGRQGGWIGWGGTNRSDKGLNLSGSWKQGHSATYNTPSRIQVVSKGFCPPLDGNCTSRQPPRPFRRGGLANDTCPWGPRPLLRVDKRTAGACIISSLDSDLEAFSHNTAHGSFAPLAFQPSAMTNCVNQRFLSY
ncbi:hypothetical protein CQW23_35144 [Capsicum baccatum]|uniref:Protein TAR1 n=1 Tax=Capsicum baccatum TaxID=33114 RepID=A0A2G2UWV1_CAPBA|nr:hypothetical protein CQW23_35144 [Capsicum baccatum]